MVTEMIRNAPQGNVFPTKADLHTPEITSSHVKGMAQYFGAEMVGIVKLNSNGRQKSGNYTPSQSSARFAPIMTRAKHRASAGKCRCRMGYSLVLS